MKTKRHAFSHEKKEPNGGARPMRWQQHRTQKNAARVNKLSRNEASTGLSLEWDPTRSTWEKERGKKQQQQQPTQTKPNRRRKNRFNELLTISIYVWSSRSLYLFLSASLLDCPSTRMSCAEKKTTSKADSLLFAVRSFVSRQNSGCMTKYAKYNKGLISKVQDQHIVISSRYNICP